MPADSPEACTADFTAALIGRDIGAALALLTDDVVFFYSNGTAVVGKDAFAGLMTSSWKALEKYDYSTLEARWIARSDTAAAVIYGFAWSAVVRGAEVGGGGRGTRVLCKSPSAGWLIAHEHLSAGAMESLARP